MKRLTIVLLVTAIVLAAEKCTPDPEHTPPVITGITAEPDSAFPGDTVKLSFNYTDAEGDSIDIKWTSRAGSFTKDPISRTESWIAPKIPGDFSIQLRLSDHADSIAAIDSIRIPVIDRPGTFTDLRDGHAYKWIKIGQQIWMAENLAYLPWVTSILGNPSGYYICGFSGTQSDAKQSANYKKYGVLYGHESAERACPAGWHLSTDAEWMTLEIFLGMAPSVAVLFDRGDGDSKDVAMALMSDRLWTGTNSSGFNALPGGVIYFAQRSGSNLEGSWYNSSDGRSGAYYSPAGSSNVYRSIYAYDDYGRSFVGINRSEIKDIEGFSVRCVKNE
jgi:uncharacterized protein (TIGR02145 family)